MAHASFPRLSAPESERAPASSVCLGCSRAVDPLRAGHVAVLGGRFRYFCRSECKQAYLAAVGRPQEEEVATIRPPEVTPSFPARSRLCAGRCPPVGDRRTVGRRRRSGRRLTPLPCPSRWTPRESSQHRRPAVGSPSRQAPRRRSSCRKSRRGSEVRGPLAFFPVRSDVRGV